MISRTKLTKLFKLMPYTDHAYMSESKDQPSSNDKEKREGILEVLDQLIFHMNTTKNMFSLLIISSFILAPIALIMAAVVAGHPKFLGFLLHRQPEIGIVILLFTIVSVILASIWLYIGFKERLFFAAWDMKFRRYISLKEQIDRELREGTKEEEE